MPEAGTMLKNMRNLGRHSERVRQLRKDLRARPEGTVIVDGRRLVEDLVRWGVRVREVFLASSAAGKVGTRPWLAEVERVWIVADTVMASIAPTRHPQGVLAVADEPTFAPWTGGSGCALYLDRVQEPGNVGAIVRAAAALGAEAVLLSPGCADPFSPAAVRGSAGAVFRVPVEREVAVAELGRRVAAGGGVWATGRGGIPVGEWRPATPLVIMLGSEGRGLGAEAAKHALGTVTIPLERGIESLNVAVAAGILLQALRR